jgi:hypothetical protein
MRRKPHKNKKIENLYKQVKLTNPCNACTKNCKSYGRTQPQNLSALR